MFTCSNCSHKLDDSKKLPPFCPRCGTATGAGASPFADDGGVPPPPPMGGAVPPPPPMGGSLPPPPPSGRGVPSKTLFGMAGLNFDAPGGERKSPTPPPLPPATASASDLPFPVDDDDLPAPSPPRPDDGGYSSSADPFYSGDPDAIPELGDIHSPTPIPPGGGVREIELPSGSALELEGSLGDLDAPSSQPSQSARRPLPPSGIAGLDSDPALEGGMPDLPMPSRQATDVVMPRPPARGAGLRAPARAHSDDFDLPAPVGDTHDDGLDLPMPVGGGSFADGLDLPMPASDLPMPASDLPMPAADLPVPALDLPTPAADLPASASELPTPAVDLPTPALDLPTSVDDFPAPIDDFPAPSSSPLDTLDLDEPVADFPAPELPNVGSADGALPEFGELGESPAPPPPPKIGGKGSPSPGSNIGRYIVYGVLGLAVLGVGGFVAVNELGLLQDDPPPPARRGSSDGGQDTGQQPPTGEIAERSEGILAKFDLDTPAGYAQALGASEDDPLAQAEAALLLHYRYGPDDARVQLAGPILQANADNPAAHVARLIGLAKLGSGDPAGALEHFNAPEPRSQLYKAWALLDQDQHEAARESAEAAASTRPKDRAASLAILESRVAANPVDGLAALRKAAAENPDHLALQEALMRAAVGLGQLADAAEVGRAIQPAAISDAHKAELLRMRAGVARAQGFTGEAMRLLDQALESDPNLLRAKIDRVDLWLENHDLELARGSVNALQQDKGKDPAVIKLVARYSIATGDHEAALAQVQLLGEAAASDPEAHDLVAQSHALLMKVDEARAAWKAAVEADPFYWPAVVGESQMLAKTSKTPEVVAFLDEHRKRLNDADASGHRRGRRALSVVERARAEALQSNGELAGALSAAEDAVAADPTDNHALLLRAMLLAANGKRAAHEDALLELHTRTGGFPGLTAPLGKVLLRQGKLEQLEALIGPSLDEPAASAELLLTGSALRLAQDKPKEAEALAQKVLDRDPTSTRAHLMLGRSMLATGAYAEALAEIERAQTRDGDADVEVWMGQALEYNARPAEARGHYEKALKLDPNNLEAAALLGRLYAYDGAAKKAIELIEPVVAETDDYPYAYLARGLAKRDLGRRDEAIADFQKARELDPTLFEAYYQEGRVHNDLNKHSAAAKALQAGLDEASDFAQPRQLVDAWRRLGESYFEMGRRTEAKKALESYLEVAPADAAGRREVERMLRSL